MRGQSLIKIGTLKLKYYPFEKWGKNISLDNFGTGKTMAHNGGKSPATTPALVSFSTVLNIDSKDD